MAAEVPAGWRPAHPSSGQLTVTTWPADETEELSEADLWAVHQADEEGDLPDLPPEPEPAAIPCPPHHWLIGDHADPLLLALRCVRCGAAREQPRDPEPVWRARAAARDRIPVPTPSFGG